MPPIQYDGRSLVPDISQALNFALGLAQEKAGERKEAAKNAELAGLTEEVLALKDPLQSPEGLKRLATIQRLDPSGRSVLFLTSAMQNRDLKAMEAASSEAAQAKRIYERIYNIEDPKERAIFIGETIRELEAAGKDTSKLRDILGKNPDQQKLAALTQGTLIGEMQLAADQGFKHMKEWFDLRKAKADAEAAERDAIQGKYGDVAAMRDDYIKQSQKYIGVRDAFTSLESALAQASPAGDIAGIFGFMKSIDPASSVREGEQATAKNAGGIPEGMRSLYNEAIGKGGLTPAQRADFLRTARGQLTTAQKSQDKLRSEFTRLAGLRAFNPEEVIVDFSADVAAAPTAPKPPSVSAAGLEGRVLRDKVTGARWVSKGGQWQLLQQ